MAKIDKDMDKLNKLAKNFYATDFLSPDDVNGLSVSKFLNDSKINNTISEEDENLIFINYEGFSFAGGIEPLLSLYIDSNSKFIRFTLMNPAPKYTNKKTIGPLIDALNENYVLMNYEFFESDNFIYISGEYWLSYKFDFNTDTVNHLLKMMPEILTWALENEFKKNKING
jgi:hypothetical protein